MKVIFDRSFYKSLDKLSSISLKKRTEQLIYAVEGASQIQDIPNIKKLSGFRNFYRVRIGDYRIGLELVDSNSLRFIVIAHRKDIYDIFP